MNVEGMPNINASVDALLSALDNTIPLVQEFLKDTSFPLEDRWALLKKSASLLPTESFGDGNVEVLGIDSPYDELNFERRETFNYSELDERLIENFADAKAVLAEPEKYPYHTFWSPVANAEKWSAYSAHYDEWREAVLARGYGSFTYDW